MHHDNKKQINFNSEDLLSLDIISSYIKKWRDIRYQKNLSNKAYVMLKLNERTKDKHSKGL